MTSILNLDGKLYRSFSLAADLVILNLLVVLSSLPVVTAGMALCAAYKVVFQMVHCQAPMVGQEFIKSIREQLIVPTVGWFIAVGATILTAVNFRVLNLYEHHSAHMLSGFSEGMFTVFRGLMLGALLVIYSVSMWFFPIAGLRTGTALEVIRDSFIHAFRHVVRTLGALALVITPIVVALISPTWTLRIISIYIVFGIAFTLYLHTLLFSQPLSQYQLSVSVDIQP